MKHFMIAALVIALLSPGVALAQNIGALMPSVYPVFTNVNGVTPVGLGFVCTTSSGTSTNLATYRDAALATPNANPLLLNASGRAVNGSTLVPIYLQAQAYRVTLYAAGTGSTCNGTTVGTQIWQRDGVYDFAQLVLSGSTGATKIGYAPSPGNITTTVGAALNSIFANEINAQNFSGTDTFAKIAAAIASSACSTGCVITDGKNLNSTETITTAGFSISGKPVHLILNAQYSYSGAAVSGGLIQISGLAASGTRIECRGFPQNLAYEQVNIVIPAGIKYTPASSSGPLLVIAETMSEAINDVSVENCSFVANSAVTDVIRYQAYGLGMGAMPLRNISIANSSTTQSWSSAAIRLLCSNAGAVSNAQYGFFNFDTVTITGNGSAINSGGGGTTSGGIIMDPSGGTGCGTFTTNTLSNLLMEGLTGTYGLALYAVSNIDIVHPIINSNNLLANGRGIRVHSGASGGGVNIFNPQMSDNDWSNNNGVVDISAVGVSGLKIIGGYLLGGSAGTTHAEDHAIDIDANTIGVDISGVTITNYETSGTVINAGAVAVRYCGNLFSVGNGAATEFGGSIDAVTSRGCAWLSNSTEVIQRIVNMAFSSGSRPWDYSADSSGHFKIMMDGVTQLDFNGNTSTTFTSSPIIPFNTVAGANVPLVMDAAGTQAAGKVHFVVGTATLNGGTPSTVTVTLTNNAVYTAAGNYFCVATNNSSTVATIKVANSSATQFVFTGPNGSTDVFAYICGGS